MPRQRGETKALSRVPDLARMRQGLLFGGWSLRKSVLLWALGVP